MHERNWTFLSIFLPPISAAEVAAKQKLNKLRLLLPPFAANILHSRAEEKFQEATMREGSSLT